MKNIYRRYWETYLSMMENLIKEIKTELDKKNFGLKQSQKLGESNRRMVGNLGAFLSEFLEEPLDDDE